MRAQAEAEARQNAEGAADAAKQDKAKAEEDLDAAPDPESRAEAEARLRVAGAAIARAQAEARARADAEQRALMLAEQKRAAEEAAREEAVLRESAERAALAQVETEAKAREALEKQIRNIQSGAAARTSDLPRVEAHLAEAPPARTDPQPAGRLVDPFELQQQAARLQLAQDADRRESTEGPKLEIGDEPQAIDPRAAGLQALVQSERRAREDANPIAKAEGDRALGARSGAPAKMPDVDFELNRTQRAEPVRQPPAFAAGSDKPSPGLLRAVAQAAALVKGEGDTPAAPDPEITGAALDERLNADRAAHDVIAEQAAARERERAAALDAGRLAERKRRQEDEARRAEYFEKLRRRKRFIRGAAITAAVVLAASATFLQFVSLTPLIPGVEQEISARLKEPVRIGSLRYPLLPRPGAVLENVVIARGSLKADTLRVPGLPFGSSVYDRVEGSGVTIDLAVLRAIPGWATTPNPAGVRVQHLQLTNVKLSSMPAELGAFNANIDFAPNGTVATAVLSNDKAALTLKPLQEQVRYSLTAQDWQIPLGPPLKFAYVDASGTADRSQVVISDFQGRVAGGTIRLTMVAKPGSAVTAEGTLQTDNVRLQEIMPAFTSSFLVGGLLKASGRYALQANGVEGLLQSAQVNATFSIARGEFSSIDIVRTVQAASGKAFRGGRTPFDDFSGTVHVAGGRYSYRALTLTSGALNASGGADIGPNGELSGQISAEVGSKGRVVARSNVALSGTLRDPAIRQ
jgi:hypothetical protein